MKLIENLKWRYATKKYDSSKKVNDEDLQKIKEAIQLSASSYGLQLFKVLIINDKTVREKLKPVSWGQSQITDASHLMVFCNYNKVTDDDVETYINLKAEVQDLPISSLEGAADFMKAKMKEKSAEEKISWTARQTYIALSNALNACAELKLDSTPIEGFDPEAYSELLKLKEKGLSASVVMAIGYRSEDDATQHAKKVRKPLKALFETL
ncbi:NAD(P)H-dependent oxidoreductase [Aquimarina sp. AD10]|uniref:NAD(P)H-dependent oxidoreductase n=1 Tax=Aquimarina sp. AD10 TaxID=1714849 RepID=UPI000E54D679|nr:NAD(P)H-dependent oxidoreductase [Aquimarina sp. AD10]AXT62662.1 NAD(P)H-dependent oxidoreductase [Aquimarina sp. AD10]RKM98342.1 NAD(P)H-dependent oxidoreductase [Aquimarina sp. AD10]